MNKTLDDSADARRARNRAVVNWFCISFLMLIVPAAEFCLIFLRDGSISVPPWLLEASFPPWLLKVAGVGWGISGVFGLLCGVRSFRLADKKSTGFGILAVFLHIGSLLLLGMIIVAFNSAG